MPFDIWIAMMWCVVFDPEHLLVIKIHNIKTYFWGSVMPECLDILDNKHALDSFNEWKLVRELLALVMFLDFCVCIARNYNCRKLCLLLCS